MTRQPKTPRQRAEEQLAVAERAVDRLTAKRDQLTADLAVVEYDLEAAAVRRNYLANHPDLNTTPAAPTHQEESNPA